MRGKGHKTCEMASGAINLQAMSGGWRETPSSWSCLSQQEQITTEAGPLAVLGVVSVRTSRAAVQK
jgi:hypothetical protein